jgi:hypothetical protein
LPPSIPPSIPLSLSLPLHSLSTLSPLSHTRSLSLSLSLSLMYVRVVSIVSSQAY